jgi:hypothetical protein
VGEKQVSAHISDRYRLEDAAQQDLADRKTLGKLLGTT